MIDLTKVPEEQLRKALALAAWYKANPLARFKPSPKLEPFMTDPARRILIRAASRVGKTKHAAARLSKEMLENPGHRYRAVGQTHQTTSVIMGGYLHSFLPKSQLDFDSEWHPDRGWKHQIIRLRNGASCEFRSDDQPPSNHAGPSFHGVWHDEPPSAAILNESTTRVMDTNGWVWVTATMVNRPVEYFKKLVEEKGSPWKQYVVEMSHANCPWYTPEQVDEFIREVMLVPDEYPQKVLGAWEGVSQERVFTGYTSACHFTDLAVIPKFAKWGVGIDHGESAGKQVAVLIAWDDRSSNLVRIWLVAECTSSGPTTPEQDAVAIREMLRSVGKDVHDVDRWIGDSNSAGKLGSGQKVNDILAPCLAKAAGYHRVARPIDTPYKGPGSVELGQKLVNAAFLRGQISVHEGCANLRKSLSYYDGQEDLKHCVDALRYILYPLLDTSTAMPTIGSTSLGLG